MHRTPPSSPWAAVCSCCIALASVYFFSASARFARENDAAQQPVHVRWAQRVDEATRVELEQRLGLLEGQLREGSTWSYRLRDRSIAALRQLVTSPAVEDTQNVDRARFRVHLDRTMWPWVREVAERGLVLPVAAVALALGWLQLLFFRAGLRALFLSGVRIVTAVPRVIAAQARRPAIVGVHSLVGPHLRWIVPVTIVGVFLAPLLIDGPSDQEEMQFGILPNQLHYRALFQGRWLFWFNDLGFGTPMPLGHRLDFNPIFGPLLGLGSLRLALSAGWLVYVTLMAVFFTRLARLGGVGRPLTLTLLFCYVFSAVSLSYFYQTDWVTSQMAWCLIPVLLYYLHLAIRDRRPESFWLHVSRMALLFGFVIINANPGYILPVLVVLTIYAVCLAGAHRPTYTRLLTAGVLCGAICFERLYYVGTEALRFPSYLLLPRPVLTWHDYATGAFAPFTDYSTDLRFAFVGLPVLAVAAVSAVQWRQLRQRHDLALVIAVIAAFFLGLAPRSVSRFVSPSGAWLFKDSLVVLTLLASGTWLQRQFDHPSRWRQRLAFLLIAAQVTQQVAAIWPGVQNFYDNRGRMAFYRYQGTPFGVGADVVAAAEGTGGRIYLSPATEYMMRGRLSRYGLHSSSDLVLLGLNPINGWFKGVSMDHISPSATLMHGFISGNLDTMSNRTLLDVLGIDLLMVVDQEPSPPGLLSVPVREVRLADGTKKLRLLRNPDAWPKAVLLSADAVSAPTPLREGCGHEGALCRNYDAIAARRLAAPVALTTDGAGHYAMRFASASEPRVLFASINDRPEWVAVGNGSQPLAIRAIAGAFVAVEIPPGVDDVRLDFTPRVDMALTVFSTLALLFVLTLFVWSYRRARGSRGAPS